MRMEWERLMEVLNGCLGELYGLELLDYHNRNHLVHDAKQLSAEKLILIRQANKAREDIAAIFNSC